MRNSSTPVTPGIQNQSQIFSIKLESGFYLAMLSVTSITYCWRQMMKHQYRALKKMILVGGKLPYSEKNLSHHFSTHPIPHMNHSGIKSGPP